MSRPRLLDLFCGAGGAAKGYHDAGFDVVGVDIRHQMRFPYEFHRADALEYLAEHGHEYDAIHASPPCQHASRTRGMPWSRASRGEIPNLIPDVQTLLVQTRRPWVIENVAQADLVGITLCGLMFGLHVFRHRVFESSELLMQPPHVAHGDRRIGEGGMVCVAGHGDCNLDRINRVTGVVTRRRRVPADHRSVAAWRTAMQIAWMTRDELAEAIPPAYTRFVGAQLIEALS